MKVGLDVRIPLIRVLSTGGGGVGRRFPQTSYLTPPPQQKVFPEKKTLFQMLILFDDDIKESVKATNVQKCNFSQS